MDLASYLAKHRIKHADFATIIGVSQVAVTRYVQGQRIPRPSVIAEIKKATKGAVTANDLVFARRISA